jgi:membrane-associated protease RseP (regulator of RpoE activity)
MKITTLIMALFCCLSAFAEDKVPFIPYLGVDSIPTPKSLAKHLSIEPGRGFLIGAVDPKGPSAQGGIKPHDIITAIDSQKLLNSASLRSHLNLFKPNTEVTLHLIRKGKMMSIKVKLGARTAAEIKKRKRTVIRAIHNNHTCTLERLDSKYYFSAYKNGKKIMTKEISLQTINKDLPKQWQEPCRRLYT